ncbi:MAG: hypothetical protein IKN82_08175 [Treponema sp.]|nr:hypothetical protein [Treponema sp.]
MQNSFIPDSDAPLTPFNAGPKKGRSASIPMYSTIQGLYQKNARMWQVIALVSLLSFFISLFICFYAVRLPKTVPVIVTVDTQGQATYVGRVSQSYWGKDKIPENAKTYQIKRLFANMYTRVTDASAQNSYIRECEKICQGDAVSLLDKFFMENNPFDLFGVKTQTIDMEEPLRQTERTYVIYYNVQKYMNGQPAGGSRHSALVTLDFYNGVPEDNPLGIYITGFDIKEVRE